MILVALPNVLWQIHNHWPTLEFLRNGQRGHKNIVLNPVQFFTSGHRANEVHWRDGGRQDGHGASQSSRRRMLTTCDVRDNSTLDRKSAASCNFGPRESRCTVEAESCAGVSYPIIQYLRYRGTAG
jgi:hypothetical protein